MKYKPSPDGFAQAFIIGEQFIGKDSVALILGDNIFYGYEFQKFLTEPVNREKGATVFGYNVNDPERFGVVEFTEDGTVTSIEEKPTNLNQTMQLQGYIFMIIESLILLKASSLLQSGELEITDVNKDI